VLGLGLGLGLDLALGLGLGLGLGLELGAEWSGSAAFFRHRWCGSAQGNKQ
jgi:hypothetical protein